MRHLQIYRSVRAVVLEESIRKGAERLAISPSALNRQILSLEEELGVPFFERLPSGVRLSTAGEIYYRSFIRHLAEIERASETVSDLQGVRIGHVRLAVSRSLEAGMLQNAVRRFRSDHPRVNFSLYPTDTASVPELLAADVADLGLATQPSGSEITESLSVVSLPVMAVVARAGFPAGGLNLAQLEDYDLIMPPGPDGLRAHLEAQARRLQMRWAPALESASLMRPWRGEGRVRPSAQFCMDGMVADGWLVANAAAVVPIQRFTPARVVLSKRAGRILPVAAERFALSLAGDLEALQA